MHLLDEQLQAKLDNNAKLGGLGCIYIHGTGISIKNYVLVITKRTLLTETR